MKTGTRVLNTESGKIGHVINDSFRCCGDNETLIVYEGTSCGFGTDQSLLEETEQIEHIPDLEKCGAGRGGECCIFLTVSGDGPCCERFTSLRDNLIFKTMTAKRDPPEPYPLCMKDEWKRTVKK